MLINSVILVLREVLEAAMLISVLLALTLNLKQTLRWLLLALPITVLTVALFSVTLEEMTDAFDGSGQEIVSAALQVGVYLCILGIVWLCARNVQQMPTQQLALAPLTVAAIIFALTREGSEIVIYITGFASSVEQRTAVFAGSAIGAGIGVSLGVILFAVLRAVPPRVSLGLSLFLLALIGAGMVMQSTMLLEQVDLMPSGRELWDSNSFIHEQSLTGQLLYAVFGYEARPSLVQVSLYLGSLALVYTAWRVGASPGRGGADAAP